MKKGAPSVEATDENRGPVAPLPTTMRAIVRDEYGDADVLRLDHVETPEPGEGQVLVEVGAASINAYDWHMLTGTPYLVRLQAGLRRPKDRKSGADVAGVVRSVGAGVSRLQPGDAVLGAAAGAFSEFVVAKEANLVHKPDEVTFEQAAAVPMAGLTALQGLRDIGGLVAGQRVLVNGASGGVGTFAVQVAKAMGASVTAVCSTRNVEVARSLGAERVIDYTRQDAFATAGEHDLIFDVSALRPWSEVKQALTPAGRYVMVGGPKGNWIGPFAHLIKLKLATIRGRRSFGWFVADNNTDDLETLATMLADGSIVPAIERVLPLEQLPAAMRDQGEGHAKGKTVIVP